MEPATIVLGDLFVVSLSNHNQLLPIVTSLLFWGGPGEFFIKLVIGFLGMQPGLCRFFRGRGTVGFSLLSPASEVELSCYSTLKAPWKLEVFFPSIWLLKLARALSYPTTEPACAFHTTRTLCMWSSSSPQAHHCSQQQLPWREGWIFLSGKREKQCRELAVWPKPCEESVLKYSFEGTHPSLAN